LNVSNIDIAVLVLCACLAATGSHADRATGGAVRDEPREVGDDQDLPADGVVGACRARRRRSRRRARIATEMTTGFGPPRFVCVSVAREKRDRPSAVTVPSATSSILPRDKGHFLLRGFGLQAEKRNPRLDERRNSGIRHSAIGVTP
jgi:hypothetical protein